MESIIAIHQLEYTYPNGTRALDKIDLEIGRGEKIAVLGSNGSGKSTLFLCLNGVLRPQSGEIRFDGKPLQYSKKALIDIRRNVGIVFQDPETQLFCVDVYQEVAFGPHNLGVKQPELNRIVTEHLASLDLLALRDQPPHFLSGGQKKRVSIAAVLAMEPQVLIFDEPTAALDPLHAGQMMELLETLSAKGMTVVMSTHNVETAYAWADRVVVMGHGKICGEGSPESVFTDRKLLEQSDLCAPMVLCMFEKLTASGVLPKGLPEPRTMDKLEQYLDQRGC
ncbi:ABC transporter ATP-binding protein [Oscillospiraceae bacterium PP1C4]